MKRMITYFDTSGSMARLSQNIKHVEYSAFLIFCVVKLVTFDPVLRGVTEIGEGSRGLTAGLRLNCSSGGLGDLKNRRGRSVVKLVTYDPVLRGVTEIGEGSRGLTAGLRLNCSSGGLNSLGVVSVVESCVLEVPSLLQQPDSEAFIPTCWDTLLC
ncbi:hypothetical protein ElyMa_000599200 [Elysia marginata]|uniref:Uncharacterized protein n=1 Tax=Elysia marginata TaxID=1093978 RepID=A0AAV4G9I6_9GAST|nr:hypothetical protein ElyMa_000599200 [Elysia marginata]